MVDEIRMEALHTVQLAAVVEITAASSPADEEFQRMMQLRNPAVVAASRQSAAIVELQTKECGALRRRPYEF
jgi:hypothetical protein